MSVACLAAFMVRVHLITVSYAPCPWVFIATVMGCSVNKRYKSFDASVGKRRLPTWHWKQQSILHAVYLGAGSGTGNVRSARPERERFQNLSIWPG